MKLATLTLTIGLLLGVATAAPAQYRRSAAWSSSPATVVGGSYYGTTGYGATGYVMPYYNYQPHWIYGYMPYGYDAYSYGWNGAYGAWNGAYGNPYATSYGSSLPYAYRSTYAVPVNDGPPARSRSSLYPALPYSEFAAQEQQQANEGRGYLNIQTPSTDAKVWINDQLMTQAGRERAYMTPVLGSTTRSYTFDIKVSWTDDLGPRTQQTTVQVRAGETRSVSFPLQTSK